MPRNMFLPKPYLLYIALATLLAGCMSDNRPPVVKVPSDSPPKPAEQKRNYNFYLETSLSTDPYLTGGNSRFSKAINTLQSYLNTRDDRKSFNIWEVSNTDYPVALDAKDEDIKNYFSNLSSTSVNAHIQKAKGANRNTSDLSTIITTVLEKTGGDDISVIVSDCVVDTKINGNNLASQQANLRSIVKHHFDKSPFSVLLFRDSAKFKNGKYYPPAGGSEQVSGYRPYFFILIGPAEALQSIENDLAHSDEHFGQSVLLGVPAAIPAASLLPSRLEVYRIDGLPNALTVKDARIGGPNKNFMLQMEVDLSGVPVNEEYKMTPENYEVSSANPEKYNLNIQQQKHARYTHLFTLSTTKLGPAHEVHLKLRNTLPAWVSANSSENPGSIKANAEEMHKTYGLAPLLKGIRDGFGGRDYYFELPPIRVKQ